MNNRRLALWSAYLVVGAGGWSCVAAAAAACLVGRASSVLVDAGGATRRVEHVRREQNEALLRVLDEERRAEENRVHFLRDAMSRPGQVSDVEKTQLEQLFAEERRKASERIVQITKAHEQNLKHVMLDLISARTS